MTSTAEPAVPDDAVVEDTPDVPVDPPAGRFHNRENPSPAEMAEILREVQDTLAALDGRLAGLEGAQGDSSVVTRRLALSVAEMGETLARRVRSLEGGETPRPAAPAPPPPPLAAARPWRSALAPGLKGRGVNTWALIAGLVVLVGLVAIGLWVFWHQIGGSAAPAKPAAIAAPAQALPPAAAPPVTVPVTAAPPRRHISSPVRHTIVRRAAPAAPSAVAPAPAGPATTGFRSFAPAPAATNSAQKPSS